MLIEWLKEYRKELCCDKCKNDKWFLLDFHHRDMKEKDFGISYMVHYGFSKKKILKEIDKCDVLCSNCHRELHFLNNGLVGER